ncbi:MAG: DUF3017 domain-containing protein [Georgenia sp.]
MSSTTALRAAVMVATVVVIAGVCVLAVVVDGRTAVLALALAVGAGAVGRAVVPPSVVLWARSRAFDVTLMAAMALALVYLAPWGNATVAGGG